MYRDCPTDPDRILDYFNNYNGGIINQVQPQVDNEVTPLVTKIGKITLKMLYQVILFNNTLKSSRSVEMIHRNINF